MSARPAEISGPVSQRTLDVPADKGGSTASDSEDKYSVNKVYVMHGLLLSGIELALTVGNAVNQDAFELNSFSDLIFGGSVVIEAVGFVFAVAMALRALMYPVAQGLIGVGVPAMVIVEALAVPGSHQEMEGFCFVGLSTQSLSFLIFTVVSWIKSPTSRPTVSTVLWISMAAVCAALLYACYRRHREGHDIIVVCSLCFLVVPFVVEISESALLFTGGSIPFVAYLLAVLDLAIIAPAAGLCFLGLVIFLLEMMSIGSPSTANTPSAA